MRAVRLGIGLAVFVTLSGSCGTALLAQAQSPEMANRVSALETGNCDRDESFAIAIHGGAVFWRGDHGPKVSFARDLLAEARIALASGARAFNVVEAVIAAMEDSGHFNAGKGSIANEVGVVEMDAAIMDGRSLEAGAVASVETVRNPISAARLVMANSRHVLLVGADADRFVREKGGAVVDVSYFLYGGQNFENVPLPSDIEVTPPDDRVATAKAAFSGTWAGVWLGSLNHVLVIEEIEPEGAKVVYALGPAPFLPDGKGLFRRLTAVFVDEGLQVTEPSDLSDQTFVVTYRANLNDSLTATAKERHSGEVYETTLRRVMNPGDGHDGGTVGGVVRDRCGDLAAGTSTGGFGSKTPGRVGDSPIIGAGTYADNETAAISATGHGEYFMRYVAAYDIAAAMKYKGLTLQDAADELIKGDLARKGLKGGVIAVDRDGNVAMPFNTDGMVRGITTDNQPPSVQVY